jgi:hypothetical protein
LPVTRFAAFTLSLQVTGSKLPVAGCRLPVTRFAAFTLSLQVPGLQVSGYRESLNNHFNKIKEQFRTKLLFVFSAL